MVGPASSEAGCGAAAPSSTELSRVLKMLWGSQLPGWPLQSTLQSNGYVTRASISTSAPPAG
jgi:hypothetical protein